MDSFDKPDIGKSKVLLMDRKKGSITWLRTISIAQYEQLKGKFLYIYILVLAG